MNLYRRPMDVSVAVELMLQLSLCERTACLVDPTPQPFDNRCTRGRVLRSIRLDRDRLQDDVDAVGDPDPQFTQLPRPAEAACIPGGFLERPRNPVRPRANRGPDKRVVRPEVALNRSDGNTRRFRDAPERHPADSVTSQHLAACSDSPRVRFIAARPPPSAHGALPRGSPPF